ncbi:MAG: DNA topoisomerase III [Candidatus Thiodiazotropha endolucinida]|nr:DNA topoisomerase III [Candidatus Thiodiazotropha taylori]MCW4262258.1 DNA topoisomerase III [Candidatus Thiodiazotropha endolucinida]
MSKLFIAEKPSLAKTIGKGLDGISATHDGYFTTNSGDTVTWAFGHLYEQANPEDYDEKYKKWNIDELPIVPTGWMLKPRSDAKKQIGVIKKLLKQATTVVNAGDPDREGQLLIDEVIDELNYKGQVLRVWLQDLSDGGVKKALADLKPNSDLIYAGMSKAAEARSRADWLVGMNLTRAFTIAGQRQGYDGVLSVGRVQTPTLALVVNRDKEIENFKPIPYYAIAANFDAGFKANWQPADDITDSEGRCIEQSTADAIIAKIKGQTGTITQAERKLGKQKAPLPFSLSELQSYCSKKFGMGAQQVLDTAQALYETHKLTSYPRTDCRHLSEGQHAEAPAIMQAIAATDPAISSLIDGADLARKSSAFNDKKITAHTGIIPTAQAGNINALSQTEFQVYDAIRRHYLAQFYPEFQFETTTILVDIANQQFKATGKVPAAQGWKICFDAADTDDDSKEDQQQLPQVSEGQSITCTDANRQDKKTTPPSRFNEGSLIKAMSGIAKYVSDENLKAYLKENSGIGTEATRAGVLEILKKRGFIAAKGKQIISTEAGRGLIAALPKTIADPATTAIWEMALEKIADGSLEPEAFLMKQTQFIQAQVIEAKTAAMAGIASSMPDCPKCDSKLKRVKSKKNGKHYWICRKDRNADCDAIYPDAMGKPNFNPPKRRKSKSRKKTA